MLLELIGYKKSLDESNWKVEHERAAASGG
jgi:hypothetical protein